MSPKFAAVVVTITRCSCQHQLYLSIDLLLTPREEQVVGLVSEGLSNRQVARELTLSKHAVKKYLFHIYDKLGISTRVELVLYAVNHGEPRLASWPVTASPVVSSD